MQYGLNAWLHQLDLVLSPVAVNLALALVTFLVCHCGLVHDSFFRNLDPCVAAVSRVFSLDRCIIAVPVFRVLLELIFVRNSSLGLSCDFIDVDRVIKFLCASCMIP